MRISMRIGVGSSTGFDLDSGLDLNSGRASRRTIEPKGVPFMTPAKILDF